MARKKELAIKPNEPKFEGEVPTVEEFRAAINWYSIRATDSEMRGYLLDGLKNEYPSNKKLLQYVKNLPETRHRIVGALYRMKKNGWVWIEPEASSVKESVDRFILESSGIGEEEEVETVSIQRRIEEKVNRFLGELEGISDDIFITNKIAREDFIPYDWMLKNEVKPLHAGKIVEYFKTRLTEYIGVIESKDKEVIEAYQDLPKDRLLGLVQYYADIIRDADRLAKNVKATRKPRKKKVITAEKQVGKMKFKTRDDTFKIQSINPESIVGSAQLWVFNTKTRKLGVYVAQDASGLSVKGCTIKGFDLNKSVSKKARKPNDVITKVLSGGKVALRHVLDDMRAKESKLNGRINMDTVLLKVIH